VRRADTVGDANRPVGGTDILIRETIVPARGEAPLAAFKPDVEADESGGEWSLSRTLGSGEMDVHATRASRWVSDAGRAQRGGSTSCRHCWPSPRMDGPGVR